MSTQHSEVTVVETVLGPLSVTRTGSGRPAFLWHSMFLDSTTFSPLTDELARHRELFLVDGPGHGSSPGPRRIYDLRDCAVAAVQLLDALRIDTPVDWLGNAWGGHVGILLEQGWPARVRTLTMIGTPAYPLPALQRRKTALLVQLYRVLGPSRLAGLVVDALVGDAGDPESRAAAGKSVGESFVRGDKRGKYWAMRSLMLRRPDLRAALERVQVPTLMIAGTEDAMCSIPEAERLAAAMPQGAVMPVAGGGHAAPLFTATGEVTRAVLDLWEAGQLPAR